MLSDAGILPLAKGTPVVLFPLRYFSMLVNENRTELLLDDRGSILGVARELAFFCYHFWALVPTQRSVQ